MAIFTLQSRQHHNNLFSGHTEESLLKSIISYKQATNVPDCVVSTYITWTVWIASKKYFSKSKSFVWWLLVHSVLPNSERKNIQQTKKRKGANISNVDNHFLKILPNIIFLRLIFLWQLRLRLKMRIYLFRSLYLNFIFIIVF